MEGGRSPSCWQTSPSLTAAVNESGVSGEGGGRREEGGGELIVLRLSSSSAATQGAGCKAWSSVSSIMSRSANKPTIGCGFTIGKRGNLGMGCCSPGAEENQNLMLLQKSAWGGVTQISPARFRRPCSIGAGSYSGLASRLHSREPAWQ